jgi:hypothetical protein
MMGSTHLFRDDKGPPRTNPLKTFPHFAIEIPNLAIEIRNCKGFSPSGQVCRCPSHSAFSYGRSINKDALESVKTTNA